MQLTKLVSNSKLKLLQEHTLPSEATIAWNLNMWNITSQPVFALSMSKFRNVAIVFEIDNRRNYKALKQAHCGKERWYSGTGLLYFFQTNM